MTFNSKIVDDTQLTTLKHKGWYSVAEEKRYNGGDTYTAITLHRRMGCCERTTLIGGYSSISLCILPITICFITSPLECSPNFYFKRLCKIEDPCRSLCYNPLEGTDQKVVFTYSLEESEKVSQRDYQQLGFDPHSAESRKKFFLSKASEKVSYLVHSYVPFQTPLSKSSNVLFAPYKDLDKTKIIVFKDDYTGAPYPTLQLHETMQELCNSYTTDTPGNFGPHYPIPALDIRETAPLILTQPSSQHFPNRTRAHVLRSFGTTRAHDQVSDLVETAAAKIFADLSTA